MNRISSTSFFGWVLWSVILSACTLSAQTAADPGEGLRATSGVTAGTVEISWWGKTGRAYFVQTSETLMEGDWRYMPMVEGGTGAVSGFNMQATSERMFVRLVYTDQVFTGSAADADFDGDGVSNLIEVTEAAAFSQMGEGEGAASALAVTGLGSDPFLPDTDWDGYSDGEELVAGTSATNGTSNPGTYVPSPGDPNPDSGYQNGLRLDYRSKVMNAVWQAWRYNGQTTPYSQTSQGKAYQDNQNLDDTPIYAYRQDYYDLIPEITAAYAGAGVLSNVDRLFYHSGRTAFEWCGFNYVFDYSDTTSLQTYYQKNSDRAMFEVQGMLSPSAPPDSRRLVLLRLYEFDFLQNVWTIPDSGLLTFGRHNVVCSPNMAKHCVIKGKKVFVEPVIDANPPDLNESSQISYKRQYRYTQLQPLEVELVPDYDRDGDMDADDKGKVSTANPWRWWINDDNDEGDLAAEDTPGQDTYADYRGFTVDGLCDLPDFFPLHLKIKPLLDIFPAATHEYRLVHPTGSLSFVETAMDATSSAQFLTNGAVADSLKNATTRRMMKEATNTLSATFLADIQQNASKGIVLIQGSGATEQPMYVQVLKQGQEVARVNFPVKIGGIEQMYRWINLRGLADLDPAENGDPIGSVSRATATGQPANRPDSLTNGKHFVMVHGYNVNEDSARGWGAEMFKRLFQMGMKAKFTMVTWQGNTSQLAGVTPDYWENVTNAFITSPHLKTVVEALPGTKIIAAHSLGNMVVSSAIQDHGMVVEKYFMLDAAVPLEAYDISHESRDQMRNPTWQDYNQTVNAIDLRQYWASDWHKQFLSTADVRKTLTWKGRFGDIPNAINYYSSGEEVLQNADGAWPSTGAVRAWVYQEMGKGRFDTAMAVVPGVHEDVQGGWGFNINQQILVVDEQNPEDSYLRNRTPAELAGVPLANTAAQPFFMQFQIWALHDPIQGSPTAAQYWPRAKTLAEGIPSLSFPTGSNPISGFIGSGRNVDLMTLQSEWPQSRINTTQFGTRWLHSDAIDVALRFNHLLFTSWINQGAL